MISIKKTSILAFVLGLSFALGQVKADECSCSVSVPWLFGPIKATSIPGDGQCMQHCFEFAASSGKSKSFFTGMLVANAAIIAGVVVLRVWHNKRLKKQAYAELKKRLDERLKSGRDRDVVIDAAS